MVAGDEQPPLGLVQGYVGGRVAGGLDHAPGADVGLDLDPWDELAVRRADAADQVFRRVAADFPVAVERGHRDAAHPPDLEPLFERGLRFVGLQPDVLHFGCIQSSQPVSSQIEAASP